MRFSVGYFFRSISRAKPMIMAINMALPKPSTYVSVIGAGVGVGSGVGGGASSMTMAVSA